MSFLALAPFSRLLVSLIVFTPSDSIGVDFPPFSACWLHWRRFLAILSLMAPVHLPDAVLAFAICLALHLQFSPDLLMMLRFLAFSALAPSAALLHLSLLSLLSLMFLLRLSVNDDPAAVHFADRDVSVLKN